MRGGPLAEKRVIDLINARVVGFYYCFRPGRKGFDWEADAVYREHLGDRVGGHFGGDIVYLQQAVIPIVVLSPGGKELLGFIDTNTQLHKEKFFNTLRSLLDKHGYLDQHTEEELSVLEAVQESPSPKEHLAAGRLHEALGNYDQAQTHYELAVTKGGDPRGGEPLLSLARIARYERDWPMASKFLDQLDALDSDGALGFADDVAMERGHAILASKDHRKAQRHLTQAIVDHPHSERLGEMHFYLGVACFFLNQKGFAYFHWWYVIKNLPDDRHYMRCFVSLGADIFPFPNYELDGYAGASDEKGHIQDRPELRGKRMSIKAINEWRDRTERVYEQLKWRYGAKFLPRDSD